MESPFHICKIIGMPHDGGVQRSFFVLSISSSCCIAILMFFLSCEGNPTGPEDSAALSPPVLLAPEDSAAVSTDSLCFWWQVVPGAETYTLQMSNSVAFETMAVDVEDLQNTNFTLHNERRDSVLHWRVRAENSEVMGPWSPERTLLLQGPCEINLFPPPLLLTPEDNARISTDSVRLWWQIVHAAMTYTLQVSARASFETLLINAEGLRNTNFVLHNVSQNRVLYWRVRSENNTCTSAWSAVRKLFIEELAVRPELLEPLDDLELACLSLPLSWRPSPIVCTYAIQVATDSLFQQLSQSFSQLTSTMHFIRDLSPGTRYYWRIGFEREGRATIWSEIRMFETIEDAGPPILVSPVDDCHLTNANTVSLEWRKARGTATSDVQVSTDSSFILIEAQENTIFTTFKFQNVLPYVKYYWRVRGAASGCSDNWSEPRSFSFSPTSEKINSCSISVGPVELELHETGYQIDRIISRTMTLSLTDVPIDEPYRYKEFHGTDIHQDLAWRIETTVSVKFSEDESFLMEATGAQQVRPGSGSSSHYNKDISISIEALPFQASPLSDSYTIQGKELVATVLKNIQYHMEDWAPTPVERNLLSYQILLDTVVTVSFK